MNNTNLVRCNELARRSLADSLFEVNEAGLINKKSAVYVAKTFPDILLDIARYLTEQATKNAREQEDPAIIIKHQLKPYLAFNLLLGKCPQITGLIYSYYENSSFQPLPENSFSLVEKSPNEHVITYSYLGFNDELIKEILLSLFKYLSFNPKWFSSVWNWSELGRFITLHTNPDIRYLAACCLSLITKPTRFQHISFIRDVIPNYQQLIDLQISHRHIYDNTFKPCIETKREKAEQYAMAVGYSSTGYSYCSESLTLIANILLLKRDIEPKEELRTLHQKAMQNYIPVSSLFNTISKIAYSISINKPCLIRGVCGSGKTAVLDYIAAHTNRLNPPDYVKVQIGDNIDSKLLIGSYVCTEIPGQFDWQPGPLTKAMSYGSWIVFEDIDSAPSDLAQVLHSVIENGNLSCVSSCPIKLDSPHPDFRIFFTQRHSENKSSAAIKIGFGFVERLCDIIEIPELNDDDLGDIITRRYGFKQSAKTLIRLYRKSEYILKEMNRTKTARVISLRDLFKLCSRIISRKLQLDCDTISAVNLELLLLDAADCFLSSLTKSDLSNSIEALGEILNIAANDSARLIVHRQPEIREEHGKLVVGRVNLDIFDDNSELFNLRSTMAYSRQSVQVMEKVAQCIKQCEPILLVGETGVGKTSIIQHLANRLRTKLTVVNLSQQSDSSDLLGDYKPVDIGEIMLPLHTQFDKLFRKTFDVESNQTFLQHVNDCYVSASRSSQWAIYMKLVNKLCAKAVDKPISVELMDQWNNVHDKVKRLVKRVSSPKESCPIALSFSEGSLLRAVRDGDWILLDEVNLAEPDVLQCLLLILDSMRQEYIYMNNLDEDDKPIRIHPNFRIFACMNPSTDIGKRDLPIGTRSRFSEFFVDDVTEPSDLRLIVESYVKTCLSTEQIANIVKFYLSVKESKDTLNDTSGNSPVYSLRTLCRALSICANNVCCNMEKSLYESLKITFLQQLNDASIEVVLKEIEMTVFNAKSVASLKEAVIAVPKDNHNYVNVQGFWIQTSNETPTEDQSYILTKSVQRNLESLARIVSLSQRKLPILIQGNTSVGKTSLISYMAKLSGNRCFRINNHEHTDLQEYVGRYIFSEEGKLTFQEGLLVKAMRKGYWIILDELNLAPSELLEALNRVLDDNRELFIPETKTLIKAHSKFILFATQNPPEEYAGRKLLSRAFRNRFVELHFDEIPGSELETILEKKCEMAPQYAKKIVNVMRELQLQRRESGCFTGKNGFMTMRDLFRWGHRYAAFKESYPDNQFFDWDAYLAGEGLILLEGRVRTLEEAELVKKVIEKVFNRKLDRKIVYGQENYDTSSFPTQFKHIHFSEEFRRLFVQLSSALRYKEPVLLCGLTGCGKTTACQLYAAIHNQELLTYNCHLNTESTDFIGGVRPSRTECSSSPKAKQTFPWVDGPLLEAMDAGAIFLMDEISLADDAVLERINSVLEPDRMITLTEKGDKEIRAQDSFQLVATMNPGGDYGKKELSPALRNRFTEIYCHNTTDISQIRKIIEGYLSPNLLKPRSAPALLSTIQTFLKEYYKDHDVISIRDVLNWCNFMNKTTQVNQVKPLSIQQAIVNGASLVFFDQFGTCGHKNFMNRADNNLKKKLKSLLKSTVEEKFGKDQLYAGPLPTTSSSTYGLVHFPRFTLPIGLKEIQFKEIEREYILNTPVVKLNIMKIVRAMQLDRPILLEGDPGAGKTSAVTALAKLTGHELMRINLSEQTDISDLFGSDLPEINLTDDETNPSFCWHDGPLLRAIKKSQWILLDEMNLASQSVLEGLNACFDHRGEIYIPELNKKFIIDRSTTKIFACQNPYSQGSARKGLPQSFLNRFTSIFIEPHSPQDLILIISNLFQDLSATLVEKMVSFNSIVASNYPYFEFNLRDLLYWCDLLTKYVKSAEFKNLGLHKPERFVQFVYLDRMRSTNDRNQVCEMFEKVFGYPVFEPPYRDIRVGDSTLIINRSILMRKIRSTPHLPELCILKYQLPYLESIAKAIEHNKMPIIVGETGVGKRSMVRIVAGLTGNQLNVVCANEEMDTIELLGSYEQKSIQRDIADLVEEAKKCINSMINSIPHKSSASTWTSLFNHIWAALYMTSLRELKLSKSELLDAYHFQLSQMKDLIEKMQPLCGVEMQEMCNNLAARVSRLIRKSRLLKETSNSSGSFEWIDSILITSIREGSWVMIENANLMNPATLDRLNSLVEANGSISLNEKGSDTDGNIQILKPHPDFRLILTLNPEYGELSRAMRNRGSEIYIQTRFFFEDFLMLLDQNGFEPEEKKACMTYCVMQTSYDFHKKITNEVPEEEGSLLTYFGLNYISTLTHEVRRGQDIDTVLADLLISYYIQRGFNEECSDENVRSFVLEKMNTYRGTYEVNLLDERYKWRHFRHDLVSLTGGDAVTAMVDRDNRIFFDDFDVELILKPDEIIDNLDIVNTCITVKIFLEQSTHGDFEYRKGFIRETFFHYPNMMKTVNNHVDLLHSEYIPLIKSLLPRSDLAPVTEMYIDSRNSPDLYYYLQAIDYKELMKQEGHQNRWILSLHRIMLRMIVELVEERSMETPGYTSLWTISEQFKAGTITRENLLRPSAEVASDLYDLLDGILRVVSNRCFDNSMVSKLIPKLFWISYFICKLKRCYNKQELIAVCNQLPMLWALTYQKVIVPIIEECDLVDLVYKNKKFSYYIQHICDSLDVSIAKPGSIEKNYYKKVSNLFAATTKSCDIISKEVDKFFATLVAKYTCRPQTSSDGKDNQDTLVASGLTWSNSTYMDAFYSVEDKLLFLELAEKASLDDPKVAKFNLDQTYSDEARAFLLDKKKEYSHHEEWLKYESYKSKCTNINRRRNALDQFAPIWQHKLIQTKFCQLFPFNIAETKAILANLRMALNLVNGIIMSPNYYRTISKYLRVLQTREESSIPKEVGEPIKMTKKDFDMYAAYLADSLFETLIHDHQIVGWTRLRTTTSDLPSFAPLIPEYSPIISLVGSYCLDISHLKLNCYSKSSVQIDSLLMYLWRDYVRIKLDNQRDLHDLKAAQNFLHLRLELENREELVKSSACSADDKCKCLDEYIEKRSSTYNRLFNTITSSFEPENARELQKAIRLIYFGYFTFLEYAPIFTLDPSIRSREKLEIYKSELAHVKLDLHFRNTLFYWKTGENLQLNEVESDEASMFPFAIKALVDRRIKLEKSISKLRQQHTNRPKSDDGSIYFDLKKDIEVSINRYTTNVQSLFNDLNDYVLSNNQLKQDKFNRLVSRCRMLIKSLERTISHLRTDYSLFKDLTTNFLVGICFLQQGLRCLYARLEQILQVQNINNCSIRNFNRDLSSIFSFNNFNQRNIETVHRKLELFPRLHKLCPSDKVNQMQSLLLRSVLVQLNHHIIISPSDIERCIPIVRNISDLFHAAWQNRKLYFEEQKRKKEEVFEYKTSRTTLGSEISLEQQEFLDICANFPTYDYEYKGNSSMPLTTTDETNLKTEEKMCKLNRSVDLAMCIDICKAHYKFIKEASCSLLGQVELNSADKLPMIKLKQLNKLEAEILYTVSRHCISALDRSFDSFSLECHMLQANQLNDLLKQKKANECQQGSLKGSIEILDEEIFDVYHSPNAFEALRFQEFIGRIDSRINQLRNNSTRSYENHTTLLNMLKLINKISSFLITDPMMKFVTGSHTLLEKLDEWNHLSIPKEDKLILEADDLVDLIKSWRAIEMDSWKSSLHRVKRKYIDSTLCDLWFMLYQTFNDPINCVRNLYRELSGDESFTLSLEYEELFYQVFVYFVKNFLEDAKLGDYQIRLDLVFSFAIQMRFASLFEQARPNYSKNNLLNEEEKKLEIDFDRLTTYVYNTYRQYQGLFEPVKNILEPQEAELMKELSNEIKIVSWQGRNLWDIKNNFRISHRKLNKVMNKYLEVLRQPLPGLKPCDHVYDNHPGSPNEVLDTDRVSITMSSIQMLVENVSSTSFKNLHSLKNIPKIIETMKYLQRSTFEVTSKRYISNLSSFEETLTFNTDAILNFNSHKVEAIVIKPNDTKEVKEEKHKLCRQMYHSKKYCLQSIFKNLNQMGVRYQRGLNSQAMLDRHILSLEPLRGMIQNQSKLVLKAAAKLVDDDLILACNNQYRKLIASNMFLLARERIEDISSDQLERIRGYSIDMVLDIVKHNRISASMYRNLMSIQAATTRLQLLDESLRGKSILVYNFSKVHDVVCLFNELVSRSFLAISKLEELTECYTIVSELEVGSQENGSNLAKDQSLTNEREFLKDMIIEIDENNSLMTRAQLDIFNSNLSNTRTSICEVSHKLRDMLNYTNKNYLYSDDDLEDLEHLYLKFHDAFSRLVPAENIDSPNLASNTILGSFKSLLGEIELNLKPKLSKSYFVSVANELESEKSNRRLELRLKKLVKEIKLAAQEIYKEECQFDGINSNENSKKRLLPFNYIDSSSIKNLLRLDRVVESASDCFMTINLSESGRDMKTIVHVLSPILFIYTQEVACYLNVILSSLHLRLKVSNQLITFFIQLLTKGFGLPYKVSEDNSTEGKTSKSSEDNAGFGEGQGDTDVTKKLEFESQLDDLRKENEEQDGSEEKPVDSHDDGVEMSTDIDGKAEGPDENDARDNNQTDDNEDEEDNDDIPDDLDKELDTVDKDEDKLDQNLWGDKDDELEEEDDKEDLRQAETDSNIQPHKDQTELQAKDDKLDDSKSKGESCSKEEEVTENIENQTNNNKEASTDDDRMSISEEENEKDEQLDLEDEANLAKQEAEQNNIEKPIENEAINISDLEDISDNDDTGLDETKETESKELDEDDAQNSEGEVKEDGEEDDTGNSENIIDQDELHNQLEAGVTMKQPFSDEELPDPIEESINRSTAAASETNHAKSNDAQDKNKIGLNPVYHVYPEDELNDDLEFEEDQAHHLPSNERAEEQSKETDANAEPSLQEAEKKDQDIVDPNDSSEDVGKEEKQKKQKRNNDEQSRENIKRQKISKTTNKEKEQFDKKDPEVDEDSKGNGSGPVKHATTDNSKNIDVIDIISSDDEDCLKDIGEVDDEVNENSTDVNLMEQIDNELKRKPTVQEHDSWDTDRLKSLWIDCTRQTGHLVSELCQQLQIVLQPTKMAKYKGDYKSGKRLNMRKIVSYIASLYMKDKIWLRRTKPSKRTYNIMIAVDNSSSMHENNCRQMTYQSLALLAKSLYLIEAGSLSVVKFGERFRCIHEFGQPYMDAIGAQWLRELKFDDTRTSYAKLLKASCESFSKQAQATQFDIQAAGGSISQLLIIISDGRNVTSEEEEVKMYLKQLRAMRVLTLFVIIDDLNRNNGCSIVDVKRAQGFGNNIRMVSYMELFPFPFYVLLRRLDSMPSVLGEALRQWYELVSSG